MHASRLWPGQAGTDLSCLAAGCFLEVFFHEPVIDVALWSSSAVRRDVPEIERLVLIGINPQGFGIDDLVYAVPEPSTLGLVTLGCLALAARRRR